MSSSNPLKRLLRTLNSTPFGVVTNIPKRVAYALGYYMPKLKMVLIWGVPIPKITGIRGAAFGIAFRSSIATHDSTSHAESGSVP